MFWKDSPMDLRRKAYALVVASAASVVIGIASAILSIRGSFEAAVVAMIAAAAAAATGNWAHWAFKDAEKLAREIGARSTRAVVQIASTSAVPRSVRRPKDRGLKAAPPRRRVLDPVSPREPLRTASEGKRS